MADLSTVLPSNASPEVYLELEAKSKLWIEEIMGEELEKNSLPLNSWFELLQDGVIICKIFKKVYPNSMIIIYDTKPISFLRASQNIENFLFKCEEELRFDRRTLFTVRDLYNANNIVKVVVCIARIGLLAETLQDYDGPRFSEITPSLDLLNGFLQTKEEREQLLKSQLTEYSRYSRQTSNNIVQIKQQRQSQIVRSVNALTIEEIKRATPGVIKLQAMVRGRISRRLYRKLRLNINYRENIVKEIFSTEDAYVSNLSLLKNVFFASLNEKGLGKNLGIQPLDLAATIILNFSKILLEKLRSIVATWSPKQLIGDVFVTMGDFLKIYTQYVQDYATCIEKIYNTKDDEFTKYLKDLEANPACHGLPFNSYLILPVQRIPRYLLLVTDLLRHTNEDHPDYQNLIKAQSKLSDVGKYVNEKQHEFESMSKVIQIANLFGKQLTDDTGITQFIRSTRRFIKEGKIKDKNKLLYVYLFNDLMLTATKTLGNYKLQSIIRIRNVKFSAENNDNDYTIKIQKSDFELELFFNNEQTREEWFTSLKDIQTELKTRRENEDEYDTHVEVVSKWSAASSIPLELLNELPEDQRKKYLAMANGGNENTETTMEEKDSDKKEKKEKKDTEKKEKKEKRKEESEKKDTEKKEKKKLHRPKEKKDRVKKEDKEKKDDKMTHSEAKIIEFLSGQQEKDPYKKEKGWFGGSKSRSRRGTTSAVLATNSSIENQPTDKLNNSNNSNNNSNSNNSNNGNNKNNNTNNTAVLFDKPIENNNNNAIVNSLVDMNVKKSASTSSGRSITHGPEIQARRLETRSVTHGGDLSALKLPPMQKKRSSIFSAFKKP